MNIFKRESEPIISFEFFPPKSEKGCVDLFKSIDELGAVNPGYVSVTYGAGGTTRERTHTLVSRLKKETSLDVVPHLTCVGSTKQNIKEIVESYQKLGVKTVLALRGDLPKETEGTGIKDFLHASDLVAFIKTTFPDMQIGVACFPEGHPETPNRIQEMEYLKQKVDCGADYMCTQLFFDNRDYYDFCERCELAGITIPIVAGIMPITSKSTMIRMAELAQGARFPAALLKQIYEAKSEDAVEKVGETWALNQVRDLTQNNVYGIHFYTLNKSRVTLEICKEVFGG